MGIRHLIAPFVVAVTVAVAGCGGGSDEPQSERKAYGRTVQELQQAPSTVDSNVGPVTLRAGATRIATLDYDEGNWSVDPFTGRANYEPGSVSSSGEVWLVGVALVTAASPAAVQTDWAVRTLWLLNRSAFVSSRKLNTAGAAVWAEYPNPPFSATVAVAELVRGEETQLVSGPLVLQSP
jgi:hypothetical protein